MNNIYRKHYFLRNGGAEFYFNKSAKDFVVEEIPLYEFSGEGEHVVIALRKKGLSTWEALQKISEITGCKARDIGYAGLKDKEGMTIQHLSLPRQYESVLEKIDGADMKVLSSTRHNNKIKIGHLKGNRFFVRIKKVFPMSAAKIDEGLKKLASEGFPNYFGYQRFGRDGDNAEKGKAIVEGKLKLANKKLAKLMVNAYQSAAFNAWLTQRMDISRTLEEFNAKEAKTLLGFDETHIKELQKQPSFFKLLTGDVLHHYPYGKAFLCEDLAAEVARFAQKGIVPTGLLAGIKTMRAEGMAGTIEKEYDFTCQEFGDRRFAWIFPENVTAEYKEEKGWYEMGFYLPKSSYATTLLEELAGGEISFIADEA